MSVHEPYDVSGSNEQDVLKRACVSQLNQESICLVWAVCALRIWYWSLRMAVKC